MMQLADVVRHLESLAPPATAEAWDNVGLLVGDPAAEVGRGLLCIDYTAAVAVEAVAGGHALVIAYHPPIFKPLSRVTAGGASAVIFRAIRDGVAIYSPHTALDVADGGTNDVLADAIGLVDRRPLRPVETKAAECKLVTFVPATHVDAVSSAMFAAGAGRIGNYSSCSFRSQGHGTFYGEAGTHPAVGAAGRLETTAEVKIETVLPMARVSDVLAALKTHHPYETPAFDLLTLAAPPTGTGIGRVGAFAQPIERRALADRVRDACGIDHMLVAGPLAGTAKSAAVCAGAGDDLLSDALAAGADVYVTGELRHHDALRAAAAGLTVLCTLHSHSERPTLKRLAERLTKDLPAVTWSVSAADVDPFRLG